ncbi:MAG: hypothetical protein DME23_15650 [Verrucomicrobia bacterium]|nr:MAG: hypothetical protein DME23_15650 [Verrucomicrobiota bacterium]
MSNGNNPKRHHFPPEFYLNGFTRDGLLWLYDRERKQYRRQAPHNTAITGHCYAFENEKGEKDYSVGPRLIRACRPTVNRRKFSQMNFFLRGTGFLRTGAGVRLSNHKMARLTAALGLLLSMSIPAEDWPQFRGPNRDSVWNETGILQTFPAEGLKVCWRAPVGAGVSSPVVAGGRVYVTDSKLEKPKAWERVHCFDEKSGKPLWTFSDEVNYGEGAFHQQEQGSPSGRCPTPIVEGRRVFTLGATGHLLCLEARKGRAVWKRILSEDYALIESPNLTSCPLIEGGLLIVVIGGKPGACVVAFDKRTGKEFWRALDDPPVDTEGGDFFESRHGPDLVAGGARHSRRLRGGDSGVPRRSATGQRTDVPTRPQPTVRVGALAGDESPVAPGPEPHVYAADPGRACVRRKNGRPFGVSGSAHWQTGLGNRQGDRPGQRRDDSSDAQR